MLPKCYIPKFLHISNLESLSNNCFGLVSEMLEKFDLEGSFPNSYRVPRRGKSMCVSVDRKSNDRGFIVRLWSHVHACVYSSNYIFMTKKFNLRVTCLFSGFRHDVNEVFALLGYNAALIGSYHHFRATYRSHLLFGLLDS
jgi:hypothetical protein